MCIRDRVILGSMGSAVYAALGGLASLGVLASMLAAWVFGRIVDKHKGGTLMTVGVVANTILHMFRPFVTSVAGVMGVNIVNETATSAYALPFMRHIFDAVSYTHLDVYKRQSLHPVECDDCDGRKDGNDDNDNKEFYDGKCLLLSLIHI